jgi:hypothetical protein
MKCKPLNGFTQFSGSIIRAELSLDKTKQKTAVTCGK